MSVYNDLESLKFGRFCVMDSNAGPVGVCGCMCGCPD